MIALDWLYYVLLLILCVVGLFINILGLPGLWLMVAAYGAYWWATASRGYVGIWSVIAIMVAAKCSQHKTEAERAPAAYVPWASRPSLSLR